MKKADLGSMFMALMAALVFSVTTGVGTRGGAKRGTGQGGARGAVQRDRRGELDEQHELAQ